MKAKINLISNIDEINRCDALEIIAPEQIKVVRPFYFDIETVKYSYINPDGEILICIDSDYFEVEYSKELIDKLETKFK